MRLWGFAVIATLLTVQTVYHRAYAESIAPGVTISKPVLKDSFGNPEYDPKSPYRMVTTTLTNAHDVALPFIVFLEVRDIDDVTIFLQYHIGMLGPVSDTELAASWLSQEVGTYQLRAFAISNFTRPEVLTEVATSQVSV